MTHDSERRLPLRIRWNRSFVAKASPGFDLVVTQRGGWKADLQSGKTRVLIACAQTALEAMRAAERIVKLCGVPDLRWTPLFSTTPTPGVLVSVWGSKEHGFCWALAVKGVRLDHGQERTVTGSLAGAEAAIVRRLLLSPELLLRMGAEPEHPKEDDRV